MKISCNLYAAYSGESNRKEMIDGKEYILYHHGHFPSKRFEKEIDDRTLSYEEFHFIIDKLTEKMQEELNRLLNRNNVKGEQSEMVENNPDVYRAHLCNGK